MARPVTLFTGQWADLPIEVMARKTKEFGFDGIELACWGDHFEVDKALGDDNYCAQIRELLDKYDLHWGPGLLKLNSPGSRSAISVTLAPSASIRHRRACICASCRPTAAVSARAVFSRAVTS